MPRKILIGGLLLLPFYELVMYFLMPQGKIPSWLDLRVTKEYIALGLALILTTTIWLQIKRIECPNKWALFFLGFMFFNFSKTPISVTNPVVDLALQGKYSAEFKVFAFFLMFCALSSIRFKRPDIDNILRALFYGAVAMSFYMILQALNLDQIYKPKAEYVGTLSGVKSVAIGGFFGQPTLAVPYLAAAIPIGIYLKKKIWLPVILIACLLTGSDFAIAAIVLLALLYSIVWKNKILLGVSIAAVCACGALIYFQPYDMFNDNLRFIIWTDILKDVFSGQINGVPVRIGLFGVGLGSFAGIFTALHQTPYTYAHNEPLQILWTCGVTGFALYFMIHFEIVKTAIKSIQDKTATAISLSLAVIVLCSFGTFVFQLGVYQFITIVLISLLYQIASKPERY